MPIFPVSLVASRAAVLRELQKRHSGESAEKASHIDELKEKLPVLFESVSSLPKFRLNGKRVEVLAELQVE